MRRDLLKYCFMLKFLNINKLSVSGIFIFQVQNYVSSKILMLQYSKFVVCNLIQMNLYLYDITA